jgi:3-phenylpropionate/trans-cinnamate dioxygenase ferredoxin reductase subunit
VVVGGGWIGAEVAASLRQLGRDVTLVIPESTLLERFLGAGIGSVFLDVHVAHGVRVVRHTRVVRALGREGRVTAVVTDDGATIEADLVVFGIGAAPRTDLARAAGIEVDDAIVVDAQLRASVPGVFAAGDVAQAWHPHYRRYVRSEHRTNAKRQGQTAGANLAGASDDYDAIPFFYSDQFEIGLEYTGFAPEWDELIVRGDPGSGAYIAFWLQDGRVAAGMNVNIWDVAASIERLVRSGIVVDRLALADPDVPLESLVAAPV